MLALAGAYHGWTMATDAVSTSLLDNPAVGRDPTPVGARGRGAEHLPGSVPRARRRARATPRTSARVLDAMASAGHGPAGFIAEPMSGNAGGIVLPDGYLAAAYDQVRAAGGLCIADEVQTGLGRLGDWFWAFESQGVVPDVVTVAKAAGNGVPVGAVVTTRAIADAFAAERLVLLLGRRLARWPPRPASPCSTPSRPRACRPTPGEVGAHLRAGLEGLVERFHALRRRARPRPLPRPGAGARPRDPRAGRRRGGGDLRAGPASSAW